MDDPRLELPQHVEFRWISRDDLTILDENRGAGDGLAREIVELALDLS